MNQENCFSAQQLLLHYYQELPMSTEQIGHLTACQNCTARFDLLKRDLDRLPELSCDVDHLTGTRMAARVTEKLHQPQRSWLPVFGASTVAAAVIFVASLLSWGPQGDYGQTARVTAPPVSLTNIYEEMPDIEFLEDLELLQELELLSQLEGV